MWLKVEAGLLSYSGVLGVVWHQPALICLYPICLNSFMELLHTSEGKMSALRKYGPSGLFVALSIA